MAELSYNDIKRAVQEATREIRELSVRESQQLQKLVLLETQIQNLRLEIEGMRRQLNASNIQMSNLINKPVQPASVVDPRSWQQLGNNIHAISVRLDAIQNYLQQVNDFVLLANDTRLTDSDPQPSAT